MKYVLATLAVLLMAAYASAATVVVYGNVEGNLANLALDGCIVGSATSTMYSCEGETFTLKSWTNTDCSGSATSSVKATLSAMKCLNAADIKMQIKSFSKRSRHKNANQIIL
eukprot:CAMPEP_0117418472 /NCGR_PEP_ID=MMETSP0758-20121206/239_1 /TAXON_ID=63605 /ORGANISM="Percolomonas cosmopolitus, Strain AE-1 (ATCC 50343)" /LENGTH=111 /DNA_ID=CAMNT_0005198981 /DNA_START=32 /DNA_END=367 /DNA_ORIENTATION=+